MLPDRQAENADRLKNIRLITEFMQTKLIIMETNDGIFGTKTVILISCKRLGLQSSIRVIIIR